MDPALTELLLRSEEDEQDQIVEAIIRLRDAGVVVPGVRIVSRFGAINTCRLPTSAIREVWAHPAVISLKAPRPLGPEDETASGTAHLRSDDIRRPHLPVAGSGVVVAAVDWGLDFDHPNFKNPDGTTRLLGLWDQSNDRGDSPEPYGYGRLHTREQINEALRSSDPYRVLDYQPSRTDRGGGTHGTHVLDIAAGNGRAGGPVGIAPKADLVFVELADRDTGGTANLGGSVRLCEAVDFVARAAGTRPWVVNLSIGRHGGPHDGKTLVELAFDELLDAMPGRFIVQSTGNYYRAGAHACGRLTEGQSKSVHFVVDPADITDNELEIWYDGHDEFAVRVDPPNGIGPVVGLDSRADLVDAERRVIGRVHHRAHDPNNGDHHIDVFLYEPGPSGIWTVTLSAIRAVHGRFDAWLERDEKCPGCQTRFITDDRDPMTTTGTIANSHLPLIVGAYDAHRRNRPVARFSSSGPTRDGRCKPDIAAPGVAVLAARSAPRGATRSPGGHTRKSGSSMATPHVTGAVALCLQIGGRDLTARRIRALVLGTAAAAPVGRLRLGKGYLDIPALVAAARRAVRGCASSVPLLLTLSPTAAYREVLYRRDGEVSRWIRRRFEIVGHPGRPLVGVPRQGDVLLSVSVGKPGHGECGVLTAAQIEKLRPASSVLAPGHLLLRRRASTGGTEETERSAATIVRRGARGPEAAAVQATLNRVRAVPSLVVDGVFGARTAAAVRFFQAAHRLVVDSIVGPETSRMLQRENALHGSDLPGIPGPCHTPELPGPDDTTNQASRMTLTAVATTSSPSPPGQSAADLVVQLTSDPTSDALAAAHAAGAPVAKVSSLEALRDLLARRKNIGRLVIISHATTTGAVRFDIGTAVSTVTLSDLAAKVRQSATVREIVFLGCTVGKDPDGLLDVKTALSAVSSEGTDCLLTTKIIGPLTADGAAVDTEAKYQALSAKGKADYNWALRDRARQGPNRGECILELGPNRKLKDVSDDELRGFAMKHGGMLIAQFTEEDGTCWKDLKFGGPGKCHRVQR